MRYAFKVFYDGSGFCGSQRQLRGRTVEGEFLSALKRMKIAFTDFRSAGRTDKGVSALGNVIALTTDSPLMKPRILNAVLPGDIRVLGVQRVGDDFNPRHANERIYRYILIDEGYDLSKMRRAKKAFIGKKSFHNFSSKDYRSPIRRINRVEIRKRGGVIILAFYGESFLWQMVRRMVTALKAAGRGEVSLGELEDLFNPLVKRKMPPSPAENLILWDVRYDFRFEYERYSKQRLVKDLSRRWMRIKAEEAIWGEVIKALR